MLNIVSDDQFLYVLVHTLVCTHFLPSLVGPVVIIQWVFLFRSWKNCVAFPLRVCVFPPSLASVPCSKTASFINAAPTQLQAQALNSWPEFRPQLTLSLFVYISLSLSLFPTLPLASSPFLHLVDFFPFRDIVDTFWENVVYLLFSCVKYQCSLQWKSRAAHSLLGWNLLTADMHSPSLVKPYTWCYFCLYLWHCPRGSYDTGTNEFIVS